MRIIKLNSRREDRPESEAMKEEEPRLEFTSYMHRRLGSTSMAEASAISCSA